MIVAKQDYAWCPLGDIRATGYSAIASETTRSQETFAAESALST